MTIRSFPVGREREVELLASEIRTASTPSADQYGTIEATAGAYLLWDITVQELSPIPASERFVVEAYIPGLDTWVEWFRDSADRTTAAKFAYYFHPGATTQDIQAPAPSGLTLVMVPIVLPPRWRVHVIHANATETTYSVHLLRL